MRSLRARLYLLWALLVVSAAATGLLLFKFYVQSSTVQIAEAKSRVDRACRDIADKYDFFVIDWKGPGNDGLDAELKRQLGGVVTVALSRQPGIEGGIWSASTGSLAYAFPTYEGTGPKTDLPQAELPTIGSANQDAAQNGQVHLAEIQGRTQSLVLEACPLNGPISGATAWSMTRVSTSRGRAYSQLLLGLGVLAFTVFGSAAFLGWALIAHSRRIRMLERALAAKDDLTDLPPIAATGEEELDRLVGALNAATGRLREARTQLVKAERLATIGRMTAGVAHEIRNPMAAIRLKAENALASENPQRAAAALAVILQQVGRLNALLDDLISLSRPRAPQLEATDVAAVVADVVGLQADVAARAGVTVEIVSGLGEERPMLDPRQIWRAVANLVGNAIEAATGSAPAEVTVGIERAETDEGSRLRIVVADTGDGIPPDIVPRIFEPFETTKASGSGLGLAIVREIAQAHGGDVRLVARPQGTAFELDVPWRRS